jgi:hypothetical protein
VVFVTVSTNKNEISDNLTLHARGETENECQIETRTR